jgi:hypothetical protein
MKVNRIVQLILILVLLLTACNTPPTLEFTPSQRPIEATATRSPEPTATEDATLTIATTPLPATPKPTLPLTPPPSLPELPAAVGSNACPGTLPSMLMPGRQGRVSNATADPNRVRAAPNAQADIVGQIPAGAYFDVLEGPQCVSGAWFKVRYENIEGWMKEGSSTEYWVMPITSDARTVEGPAIEVGGITLNLPAELGAKVQIQDVPFNSAENIPPVTLIRLPEYRYFDTQPSIYIYPVEDYLYYRADLRTRLEGIRSAINLQLADPGAQISLPEFRDPFNADQAALLQVGRFANGYGLHAVSTLAGNPDTPYYIFQGFSTDMASVIYVRLPVRLAFGQVSSNSTPYDFSPTIDQLDLALQFRPLSPTAAVSDPTAAGECPGAPPFTLMLGDWAMVSIDPPQSSRIRSNPGSTGEILGEAPAGDNLLVIDGPQCASGYSWWKVRTLDGLEGWTVEGDTDAYWLVNPLSPWYQLPPPLSSENRVTYNLLELDISIPDALVSGLSGEYYPLATPMPTPAAIETPWPDDPRASIYTSAGHAAHSTYVLGSDVVGYARITVYDIMDPLNRFYINGQSNNSDCTGNLIDNLQNDPPVESYVQWMCGIGGGIPLHFIADVQKIDFTGGSGLRFLIASGNYLTVNELTYIFQGVSDNGDTYINIMIQNIRHPYIVDAEAYWDQNFGPFLAWMADPVAAEASYDSFNTRMETLLDAHLIPTYPDLSLLDAMMASIVTR